MSAVFWFMDNHLCSQLTEIRLQLETSSRKNNSYARLHHFSETLSHCPNEPIYSYRFASPLTQLHGWWHIGTAISANFQTNFVAFHRRQITGIGKDLEHGVFTLVEVEKEGEVTKQNGTANGTKPKDKMDPDKRKTRSSPTTTAGKRKKL